MWTHFTCIGLEETPVRAADTADLCSPTQRRVVIAGGGYAGMTLATTLAHRSAKRRRHRDRARRAAPVPAGALRARPRRGRHAAAPVRRAVARATSSADLPIKCVYDRLECVHPAENRVTVGPRESPTREIPYWRLVVATGAIATVPPVPGLAEHAHHDVVGRRRAELQRRIEQAVQARPRAMPDRAERASAL